MIHLTITGQFSGIISHCLQSMKFCQHWETQRSFNWLIQNMDFSQSSCLRRAAISQLSGPTWKIQVGAHAIWDFIKARGISATATGNTRWTHRDLNSSGWHTDCRSWPDRGKHVVSFRKRAEWRNWLGAITRFIGQSLPFNVKYWLRSLEGSRKFECTMLCQRLMHKMPSENAVFVHTVLYSMFPLSVWTKITTRSNEWK